MQLSLLKPDKLAKYFSDFADVTKMEPGPYWTSSADCDKNFDKHDMDVEDGSKLAPDIPFEDGPDYPDNDELDALRLAANIPSWLPYLMGEPMVSISHNSWTSRHRPK